MDRRVALMLFLLSAAVLPLHSLSPGDAWSFELMGYRFFTEDGVYFLPADYPGLEEGLRVITNESAPPPRWEYETVTPPEITGITFLEDRQLRIDYRRQDPLQGYFWDLTFETPGFDDDEVRPPYLRLQFVDEERSAHTYSVTVGSHTEGYLKQALPKSAFRGVLYALYRVDFGKSELPEIDPSELSLPFIGSGL